MVKKCLFCGRYFKPDPRVGQNQKACFRDCCKRARKQLAQNDWLRRNPDYFRGRSACAARRQVLVCEAMAPETEGIGPETDDTRRDPFPTA